MGWIGDPPGVHGRVVHSLGEDRRSIGEPPPAAHARKLLGGDEVGEPPRHRVRFGSRDRRRQSCREVGDDDVPIHDAADSRTVRRDARVHGPGGKGQLPRDGCGLLIGCRRGEIDDEDTTAQGEACRRHIGIGGEGSDSLAHLAHAFPTSTLGVWDVLGSPDQGPGVDEPMLARLGRIREIEQPQIADGIGARRTADEHHACSVGGRGDQARCAKPETAGARTLAGVTLHPLIL